MALHQNQHINNDHCQTRKRARARARASGRARAREKNQWLMQLPLIPERRTRFACSFFFFFFSLFLFVQVDMLQIQCDCTNLLNESEYFPIEALIKDTIQPTSDCDVCNLFICCRIEDIFVNDLLQCEHLCGLLSACECICTFNCCAVWKFCWHTKHTNNGTWWSFCRCFSNASRCVNVFEHISQTSDLSIAVLDFAWLLGDAGGLPVECVCIWSLSWFAVCVLWPHVSHTNGL